MLTPAGALRLGIQQQPRSQQLAPLSVHGGGFGTPSTALAPRPQAGVSAMTEAERRLDLMCAKSDMAMAEEEREARALRERVAALRVERTAAVEECKRMRAALNAAAVGLESVRAEAAAKDEALVQRKALLAELTAQHQTLLEQDAEITKRTHELSDEFLVRLVTNEQRIRDVHADLLRALPSRSAGADPSAAAERLEAARQQISALSDQVEEEVAALAQEKRRLVCFRLAAAGVTTLSLAQE